MTSPKENKARYTGKIDTRKVPASVRTHLAGTVYNAILQDLQRPEFMEGYLKWKAERAAAGTAT